MKKGISPSSDAFAHPELEGVSSLAGSLDAGTYRFGIVVSRFNTALTDALLISAVTCLKKHHAQPENIFVVHVPGAFEIPTVLESLAKSGTYNALMALGVVIQGETSHAGVINTEVARSCCDIARRYGVPVIDGVIGAGNLEQAAARATTGEQSRGWYVAQAAVEMADIMARLTK